MVGNWILTLHNWELQPIYLAIDPHNSQQELTMSCCSNCPESTVEVANHPVDTAHIMYIYIYTHTCQAAKITIHQSYCGWKKSCTTLVESLEIKGSNPYQLVFFFHPSFVWGFATTLRPDLLPVSEGRRRPVGDMAVPVAGKNNM